MIHGYIDASKIIRGDLRGLEDGERDEALRRFAQGIANLTAKPAPVETALRAAEKLLYDAAAAGDYLDVPKSFIRKAYRDGKLLGLRVGSRYVRFTKDALDFFALSSHLQ